MIHFHLLPVKSVRKETDDCVSLLFNVPDDLQETFRFIQGQTLTLRKILHGQEVRRNYSICSSPYDNELRVAVKKVPGGIFSTYANEALQPGDFLEVMPPTGVFYTELSPTHKKNYVAFAAGSGITPILSIIKTTLKAEPHSTFTLVYGNRTKASILFKEELEALKDRYLDRFRIYYILSREVMDVALFNGRIDAQKCAVLFSKLIPVRQCHEFFLCGPQQMIFTVRDYLLQQGVTKEHIHFELFTVPGESKTAPVKKQPTKEKDDRPQAQVSVKLDGILFDFALPFGDQSILDAALQQGADLPYACKGGVCCTCKAKLLEGRVEMDVHWGLEDDEIAQGYILTCQAHPLTEKVIVDFDVK